MAKQDLRAQLDDLRQKLSDPFRLRLLVALIALMIVYLGIFSPLDAKIAADRRRLREEERRARLAEEVELLQAQYDGFEHRLQSKSDVNEWVQFVLNGVRQKPLKLVNLDVVEERKVMPYRALVMKLHVTGKMKDLDQLIGWLETNERLFRIDTFTIDPAKNDVKHRSLQMTLLALKV